MTETEAKGRVLTGMVEADWIVDRVRLAPQARRFGGNAYWRFQVEGRIAHSGERFCWTVCDLRNSRYDLSGAEMEPEARALLGEEGDGG